MIASKNKYKEFPCRVLGSIKGSNAAFGTPFLGVLSMYSAKLVFSEKVFNHLQKYYDLYVACLNNKPSFEYWLYCMLLNRLIDLQILDEFGEPNLMVFPDEA